MKLERFGFPATQTRVYLALLRTSPASGYALAREAALARANTYAALESLVARGAAARLPGRPARDVATDPGALIGRLERELKGDLALLSGQLASVARSSNAAAPQTVETLTSASIVLERMAACAASAESELVAVVGPWAAKIYPDLASKASRPRLSVRLLSLGSPAPAGALVRPVAESDLRAYWEGLPVAAVADRRFAVCALLDTGDVAAGMASEHPALVRFLRHLLRRELASRQPVS